LVEFLDQNPNAGIVSPLILNSDREPLNMQGYRELNLVNGFFTFFFLRKRFRSFSFSDYYSFEDWQKQPIRKVDTVYGAALMISSKIFKELEGFDESFFLYFEENDLSRRARKLGAELYINSNSRVIHEVGQSTNQFKDKDKYFSESRFLYFKKNFGIAQALVLEFLLKINKASLIVLIILLVAFFLRTFNLGNSMTFIGDQGWFYLSARDMLVSGKIPLVGIASSHVWLHQGPLWTYMLAVVLWLSKFNPVSGAYLTAGFGTAATFLMYWLGREMFSRKVGLIAALLYATSPLIIFFDRMAFDPSPIPFFTILYLFALYKWIKGNVYFFPLILMLLAILYNLELATFALVFAFVLLFAYGFWKKKHWVKELVNKKIIVLSLSLPILIMLPVVIYDFSHGFKQTVVFLGWTLYKPFSFLIKHSASNPSFGFPAIINFIGATLQKLIFNQSLTISVLIFSLAMIALIFSIKKTRSVSKILLAFLLLISLGGILVNQATSDAYLPILFPFVIFSVAILFAQISKVKQFSYLLIPALLLIVLLNFYAVFRNDQTTEFKNRLTATEKIIKLANNQRYNLIGRGGGSQFESFTMSYQYLLWWKGHPVSNQAVQTKIVVWEMPKGIIIYKQ
jgi:4-amino-4-deoxy-L-arabinose transferase-like glycosyltransferase